MPHDKQELGTSPSEAVKGHAISTGAMDEERIASVYCCGRGASRTGGPTGAVVTEEPSPGTGEPGQWSGAGLGVAGPDLDILTLEGGGEGPPEEAGMCDGAGFRNSEAKGQRQENNCEDAEVFNAGSVGGELKEGTSGEPGARTRREGRQAGRTQG